jgi:hypothetical protein
MRVIGPIGPIPETCQASDAVLAAHDAVSNHDV